jgi:hypothetical protein
MGFRLHWSMSVLSRLVKLLKFAPIGQSLQEGVA